MGAMKKLAEKQPGVDNNPNHRGQIIDVGIVMVARKGEIYPDKYIKYIERCWDEGFPRLYVLAQDRNITLAEAVVMVVENKGIYKVKEETTFWTPKKRGGYLGGGEGTAKRRCRLCSENVQVQKGSGTVVRSTLWAVPATVPDPFLNHANSPIHK